MVEVCGFSGYLAAECHLVEEVCSAARSDVSTELRVRRKESMFSSMLACISVC